MTDPKDAGIHLKAPRYGFGGRLNEEFPSQIIVDATEVCNLACIHCPHEAFRKSEHYGARYLDPVLHRKLIDEVRDFGGKKVQYIRYTSNGEPLLHPRIFEMLDYAVAHAGTPITLTTNGVLLNDERIGKLLSCGLHLIDVSLDAFTPKTYARIRVKGQLECVRGNVQRLIKEKRRRGAQTRIVVSFVEQPENHCEKAEFERFWRHDGADDVVIRRLHSSAGAVKEVADSIRAHGDIARRPCLYPWERILLNPRGELAFCPQDWVHGSVVASLQMATIRETWQGAFYQSLRKAHLENDFLGHDYCGNCPDWQQTRWPNEGRSYADMVMERPNQP